MNDLKIITLISIFLVSPLLINEANATITNVTQPLTDSIDVLDNNKSYNYKIDGIPIGSTIKNVTVFWNNVNCQIRSVVYDNNVVSSSVVSIASNPNGNVTFVYPDANVTASLDAGIGIQVDTNGCGLDVQSGQDIRFNDFTGFGNAFPDPMPFSPDLTNVTGGINTITFNDQSASSGRVLHFAPTATVPTGAKIHAITFFNIGLNSADTVLGIYSGTVVSSVLVQNLGQQSTVFDGGSGNQPITWQVNPPVAVSNLRFGFHSLCTQIIGCTLT